MSGRPDPFVRYPPVLRVACPRCGAGPCTPCRSARGQRSDEPHSARRAVVERAARIAAAR